MKKVFLTLVVLLMAVSFAFSENVTVQTAQRAAQSFLNSKMEGNPQIHLIDFAEKTEFPNFYVFGNEHCFVIIAADDCVCPVLGYSTEGGLGTNDMPDAVSDWLKAYDREISTIKESRLEATMEIRKEWEDLLSGRGLEPKSRSFVKPLIRTKWSQSAPFNNLCPPDTANHTTGHAVAGCGAIAMAQIMNYWEHPVRGVGSHSYRPHNHPEYDTLLVDFGNTVYDWDNMKNLYTRGYSDAEALAVATLVYHCGVSINMDYGPSSSNAGDPILDDALRNYFDYSSTTNYVFKSQSRYSNTQWISMLKNDLDNLQPVLYRASSNNQGANAHIFICDGYDENDFFHFEWGRAGGQYDGYYTIADLHQNSINYTYGNAAMFGCRPNETSINPPSNVATTVDGRVVTISWSPVPSSAYYKVYRDGDLIANNLTGTSYTDSNASYGSHTYYVKSVKSDGTMSLRSNIATVDLHFTGPVPSNFQAAVIGHNVNLSWQTPNFGSEWLQYGTGNYSNCFPTNNDSGTYWAQRYPASILSNHAGMAVAKVSVYFKYAGSYLMQLYLGDECRPEELLYQRAYEASAESWQDINVTSPVFIDFTQDLWVVMYGDSIIEHPATYCNYTGEGVENSALYSFSGSNWVGLPGNYRSWLMKTYLTDGTYTYNLYRNGNAVATNLSGNTYTDSNLPDGLYNYHVTTNYFGGESDPSNIASVQIGTPVTQTINFASGWNWWSSCVELSGIDGLTMLENSMGSSGLTIKSRLDGYVDWYQYNGSSGWFGSLNSICNEQMYKINMSANCSVAITGLIANPSNHPITINSGWNWIGFPLNQSVGVDVALSGFSPAMDDVIKGRNSYTTYYSSNGSTGWFGSLNTLEPGCGYMYQSQSSGTKTLVFQPSRGEATVANITPEDNFYQPADENFADNMTITAVLELDGEELRSEDYELAAFVGEECRGSVRLMYVEPIDRYVAFLTVFGESSESLYFRLTDGMQTELSMDEVAFVSDGMAGTLSEPMTLHFGMTQVDENGLSKVLVYPNPSNGVFNVQGQGIRKVEVFNAFGQAVVSEEISNDNLQIDLSHYEPAVYILRIQMKDGGVVKQFIKE